MFVLEWQAPNGALTSWHRATSYQGGADAIYVVVDSYHSEEMAIISWRDTYPLPPGSAISSLADAEALLTAPDARFAGATLVPVAAVELGLARVRAWAATKVHRDRCAGGGCQTAHGRVDSDERSRILIAGAVQMAQIAMAAGEPYSVDWVMADNQPVTHDAPAMITLGLAVGQHIAACWARAQALRAEIDAAETIEAVAAIDITTGWPGIDA